MIKFLKTQKGIALLEVVIAIAILGIITGVYLTANSTTFKAIAIARRETISQRLAQAKMERVKSPSETAYDSTPINSYAEEKDVRIDASPPPLPTEDLKFFTDNNISLDGYTIRVEANPVPKGEDDIEPMTAIQKITVTVKLRDEPIFTLEDYKTNR